MHSARPSSNNIFTHIFLLLCLSAAAALAEDCAGGYGEGAEAVMGAYYYRCSNGHLEAAGCMSDTQQKVPIGSSYKTGSLELMCAQDGQHLTVRATACISDSGQRVAIGDTVDGDKVYLICQQNGYSAFLKAAGCLKDSRRVEIDTKLTVDDQILTCQRKSTKLAELVASGCVFNGISYSTGTQFSDDTAVYNCARSGDRSTIKAVGCSNNGKNIYDLDLYQKSDVVYRCRVQETTVSKDIWGCAKYNSETSSFEMKSLGCTWMIGTEPIQYIESCEQQGDSAVIKQIYCLYAIDGGKVAVEQACYRIFEKVVVGCQRLPSGQLYMETFELRNINAAIAKGLRSC